MIYTDEIRAKKLTDGVLAASMRRAEKEFDGRPYSVSRIIRTGPLLEIVYQGGLRPMTLDELRSKTLGYDAPTEKKGS